MNGSVVKDMARGYRRPFARPSVERPVERPLIVRVLPVRLLSRPASRFYVRRDAEPPRSRGTVHLRAPYSLTLFGSIDLRGPHGAVSDLLVQSKAIALLAYLSVPTMGRFVRRDTLVGLLWPELEQPRARKALRQTILAVRSGIGGDALVG